MASSLSSMSTLSAALAAAAAEDKDSEGSVGSQDEAAGADTGAQRSGDGGNVDGISAPDACGKSRWDSLPGEISLLILAAAGPLTQFLYGALGPGERMSEAARIGVWRDALAQGWGMGDGIGGLGGLPLCRLRPQDAVLCDRRDLYGRLCAMFAGRRRRAQMHLDDIPLRHMWLDLIPLPVGSYGSADANESVEPTTNEVDVAVAAATPAEFALRAIRNGHSRLLHHLLIDTAMVTIPQIASAMPRTVSQNVMHLAIVSGHMDVIRLLYSTGKVRISPKDMNRAAEHGHLGLVQWLHAAGVGPCSTDVMDLASSNGHLSVVRWLHEHRPDEGPSRRAMDWAAMNGHLHVIQWLHENRTEGCTHRAMDTAAMNGHLGVVRWFHDNRTEGCTVQAMDLAAEAGHLLIVKWLHENRSEGCTVYALNRAANNRHQSVVEWLLANRTERFEYIAVSPPTPDAIARMLVASLTFDDHADMLSVARRMGDASAFRRLLEYFVVTSQR